MKRTLIPIDLDSFPALFHPFLSGAHIFDSSCSNRARVYYIEKGEGFFLKTAPKGALRTEAELTDQFHRLGLAAEVLDYQSEDKDWLLTTRVAGEDCTHPMYLADPIRLCDTIALQLRALHEIDPTGCPVSDRTAEYLATAEQNYHSGMYDTSLSPGKDCCGAVQAWEYIQANRHLLKSDTLLHGDYCLPNIMLDDWRFSGFIDLDGAGVGDRHVDLFWGAWTLNFNLHTNRYRDRFFDAYGRDKIDPSVIELIEIIERFG